MDYGNATAYCADGTWSPFPPQFAERYSYTKGGLVTRKRLTVTANVDTQGSMNLQSKDLDTVQTYDNEGKVLTVTYPNILGFSNDSTPIPGATYTYTYDGMGRPITLADNRQTPVNWVQNVQYGASNELKQIDYRIGTGLDSTGSQGYSYYQTETRAYNIRGQLTNIVGALNVEYRYSATQNNGQITQMMDHGSGEEVTYQYDSLQRLISAVTTGPDWGQSFTYDGFGNRTGATVTKGSAPSSSMVYNPATNRIVGESYDANGNMLSVQGSTLTYDVDNRVASATMYAGGTEYYSYTPDNKRIWKLKPNGTVELYFYGISGQKLGTYNVSRTQYTNTLSILTSDLNVYFGSRTIVSRSGTMARDRLGSSRTSGSKYYPYGEEQVVTAQDRDKFATYYRDGTTGLDYAQNRYYANTLGRFTSPDAYMASSGPSAPQSWNRYSYTQNDPLNYSDPTGNFRDTCIVDGFEIGCRQISTEILCAEDSFLASTNPYCRLSGGGGPRPDPPPPPQQPPTLRDPKTTCSYSVLAQGGAGGFDPAVHTVVQINVGTGSINYEAFPLTKTSAQNPLNLPELFGGSWLNKNQGVGNLPGKVVYSDSGPADCEIALNIAATFASWKDNTTSYFAYPQNSNSFTYWLLSNARARVSLTATIWLADFALGYGFYPAGQH